MRRSAVRELLKLTVQPEMISFAGGLPAPELFPIAEVQSATEAVLRRQGARALQYGETEGIAELRDWIAARYSTSHRILNRENIVVTSGAQQALDLFGRVFLDPGDLVLTENPTYLAALTAWRPLGAEFRGLDLDSAGLCLTQLEASIQGAKAAYLMPNFQNPSGT
jgi:2-aminoadipate transaminase